MSQPPEKKSEDIKKKKNPREPPPYPDNNLRSEREERDLSREKLAELLHVSPDAIKDWEAGYLPNDYNLNKICKFFGKSKEELWPTINDVGTKEDGSRQPEQLSPTPSPAPSPEVAPIPPTPAPDPNRRNIITAAIVALIGGGGLAALSLWERDVFSPHFSTSQPTPPPLFPPRQPRPITIGTWIPTGNMARPRYLHCATLLTQGKSNDKVLVAGGLSNASTLIDTTELFDPQTNSWRPTTVLNQARVRAILVTLRTGEAIIAGGTDAGVLLDYDSTERFNPDTEVWKYVAPLNTPRRNATATLLQDGYHVLVAGGAKGPPTPDQFLDSAEIYDAKADIWRFTDNKLTMKRQEANSVLLNDGRVMVAGGEGPEHFTPTIELFSSNNKGTGTWSLGKSMTSGWKGATMNVLPPPDNRVLVIGGGPNANANPIVRIYDPITNTWTEGRKMNIARSYHTASLLPNYHVLIVGGTISKETEIYDPEHDRWYAGPPLNAPRNSHIAITLNDHNILIIGGKDAATGAILSSCERLHITMLR
jgi:N-acetylneuraminic acid mutarotase/transcriptional regulator with XRE-family HTH domain